MTVELYDEFYAKYVEKLLGNFHSNDIKDIIKEIYETGLNDGQTLVYKMRYGNTQETSENTSITCIKLDAPDERYYD